MTSIAATRQVFDRKKATIFLLDHIIELFLIVLILGLAFIITLSFVFWLSY